jgi:hypothetical protein
VVERVKQNLVDRGLGAAELIPTIDRVIILGDGENLATIRTSYAVANSLGIWLPFITIGLFALGILIARRRSVAVLGTGIGFAIGGATLAVMLAIGDSAMGIAAGALGLSLDALDVIYEQLVGNMTQTALVITFLGVVIAILGWVMGGSRPARGFRSAVDSMNSSARRELAVRGLNTDSFGVWLGRQRILVRTIIAVLAVLWLIALRPLSVGDIVLVAFVAIGVAWLLELLQRRPDEMAELEAEDDLLYSDVPVDADGMNPTVEILPADEYPTLDLTPDAATGAAAASKPSKGSRPTR